MEAITAVELQQMVERGDEHIRGKVDKNYYPDKEAMLQYLRMNYKTAWIEEKGIWYEIVASNKK
jgi:hypothetical protein